MFHKIAKYYIKKRDFDLAIESLEEAQKLENVRHRDTNVMITKAKVFMEMGRYENAFQLADKILHQKGILVIVL